MLERLIPTESVDNHVEIGMMTTGKLDFIAQNNSVQNKIKKPYIFRLTGLKQKD